MASRALSHPGLLERATNSADAPAPPVKPVARGNSYRWVEHRPSPTNRNYTVYIDLGVIDDTGGGAFSEWAKFRLAHHARVAEKEASSRETLAMDQRSFPKWFNAIAAFSLLLLLVSPLAIFWSTRAAVLSTLVAVILVSTISSIGPVLRRATASRTAP